MKNKDVYMARMASMAVTDAEMLNCSSDKRVEFQNRVSEQKNGCWHWQGHIARSGYGIYSIKSGRRVSAHRFALILELGLPPSDGIFYACHTCAIKHCVNPGHLYWGTPKQNVRDAWDDPARRTEEYRMRSLYNEKISNDAIRDIWRRYWFVGESMTDLASEYECTTGYLMKVVNGTYRFHITKYLDKPSKRDRPDQSHKLDRNGRALFANSQVQAMRLLLNGVNMESNLAIALGVQTSVVSHIATGLKWSDLPWPDGTKPRNALETNLYVEKTPVRNVKAKRAKSDLGKNEIREIYNRYWYRNEDQRELALDYGTTNCLVSFIANKKWGAEHTADLEPNPDRKKRVVNYKSPFGGYSKITREQLDEIRRYIAYGLSNSEISRKYKTVSVDMVRNIRNKKSYANV